jgi:hypothetical protein
VSTEQDHAKAAAGYLRRAVSTGGGATVEDHRFHLRSDDPMRVLLVLAGIGHALLADIELRKAQQAAQEAAQRPRRRFFWFGAR